MVEYKVIGIHDWWSTQSLAKKMENALNNHSKDGWTLDSFEFSKVDFIKMDIQGSEVKALRGAKKILLSQRPILFIEIEEQCLRALNSSTKELIETLFSLKYGLYRIENHYPCDYICIPIEKSKTFEDDILNKLSFPISKKIFGKTAIVTFDKETDQIYSDLKVF